MSARKMILAIALLFGAPSSSAQAEPDWLPPPPPPPIAANVAALSATLQQGQWSFEDDGLDGVHIGFGQPGSKHLFSIDCKARSGRVTFTLEHALSSDQDTTLTLITNARTIALPARSHNEGEPSVSATVDGDNPEFAALMVMQERFAAQVVRRTYVFPWDVDIGRTLAVCGASRD